MQIFNTPTDPPAVLRMRYWSCLGLLAFPLAAIGGVLVEGLGVGAGLLVGILVPVLVIGIRSSRVMTAARRAGYQLCLHCAYDLRSLRYAEFCPECGRPYDPDTAEARWRDWCLQDAPRQKW